MPRNGSGIYSLPSQYLAETGQTIEAVQHNAPLEDLAADANNTRPVNAGGTGEATAPAARQTLGAGAAAGVVDKAAGTYLALKADYNMLWRATGAVTVNLTAAATLKAGWVMQFQADGGAITLDPSGSEQINGAATFTVANGSSALIICTGSAFRAVMAPGLVALQAALSVAPWLPRGLPTDTDPDLNTYVSGGFVSKIQLTTAGVPNAPASTGLFYLLVFETSATRTTQMLFPYTNASQGIWFRTQTSSWSAWERFARYDEVLPLLGGTMTGALTLAGDPTAALHAATKQYVDNEIAAIPSPSPNFGAGNAALAFGSVGTYAFCKTQGLTAVGQGSTVAGSFLSYVSIIETAGSLQWQGTTGGTPSGTWRNMGQALTSATSEQGSIFLRVS